MSRSRKVTPESDRLPLSDGDWILVKRRLNAGEQRARYQQSRGPDAEGAPTMDLVAAGLATVRAYLLDWSLGDADETLVIRDASSGAIADALDGIDHETFVEILRAIEAHEEAQTAARAEEKKVPAGASGSSAISPLPAPTAGASSGSPNSTPTSTPS